MKKYILGVTIVSMLSMASVGLAMEKKDKKEMPATSLSSKEVAELRQAMIDYKKDRSRSKQEKIINKYKNEYSNDPFVKAKLNEKARFDNPEQPVKKSTTKKTPNAQQPVKEEIQIEEQSMEGKPNLRITNQESQRIEVYIRYVVVLSSGGGRRTIQQQGTAVVKIIEPQKTIVMYVPEADRRDIDIDVYTLDSSMNRYAGHSDVLGVQIKKGEMLDVMYKDDRKYYPWERDKFGPDPDYYRSSKSAPHLYEISRVKI